MRIIIKAILIVIFLIYGLSITYAQCPTSDFDVLPSVCIDQNILVTNNSVNYTNYTWSYCDNNYLNTITGDELLTLSNISAPRDIVTILASEGIYSFIIGENNRLIRLFFGNEITNTPEETNFQDVNGALSIPKGMEYYQENGRHYLLVALHGGTLVLLDFGVDLNSTPVSSVVLGINSLNSVKGLKLYTLHDGSILLYAIGVGAGSRQIGIINFGNSILNTPVYTEFSLPNASGLTSLSLIKDCDQWFGVTTSSVNNKIFKLFFGNDASTINSDQELTGITAPHAVDIKWVDDKYYALVSSDSGDLFRIDFGSDFSLTGSESFDNLGNLGLLASPIGFDVFPINDNYQGLAVGFNNKTLSHLSFSGTCPITAIAQDENIELLFAESGGYQVTLTSIDNSGSVDRITKSVTVSSNIAPDITSSIQNICLSNPIDFTSQNTSGDIISYLWDFGDTNSSTGPNPSHTYATAGQYEITLDVTSSNGCGNFTMQTITIYDEPVPDFTMPSGTICTNQDYTFVNNTTDNFDGNLTYDWQINGQSVGTDRDLIHQFTSGGAKEIKLITSIPGCSVNSIQNLSNVEVGAVPAFSVSDECLGTDIVFNNQSTGNIESYNWDFGDTNTSTDENPSHQYNIAGTYDVVLTVTNTAGCETTQNQQVTVHSLPQAQFSNDLPCSDGPIQFFDETTVANANIMSRTWDFGDGSSSTEQIPQHVYDNSGQYTVTLTASSNFGCSDTHQVMITVMESPEAIMDIVENCIGEAYTFTDVSTANTGGVIQSRFWSVDGTGYTTNTVDHIFNQAGEYEAILSITSDNLCTSVTTTIIQVDDAPEASFTVSSQCVGTPTVFVENTNSPNDYVESWYWDFSGLGNDNSSSPNFQFDQPGSYNVSLDIVTAKGCVSSMTQLVEISTSPVADFSASLLYGSAPLNVNFTNQSTGATEYLWTYGDALGWGRDTDGSFTFEQEGAYTVRLTAFASDGCEATKEETIYVVTPSIDLAIDNIQPLDNEQYVLTISNQSNIPIDQFLLSIDLGSKVSLNELIDLPLVPGQSANHQIPFSIPNHDVDHICFKLMYEGDITESNLSNNEACIITSESNVILRAYPNPVKDIVVIPVIANAGDQLGVQLADVAGNVLLHNEYTLNTDGLNELVIDLALVRKGIYVLVLSGNNVNQTQRIFVE